MDTQPVALMAGSLSYITQTDFPALLKRFYRGEPLALGIVQIFIGVLQIIFGMLIDIVSDGDIFYLILRMPYWTGFLYIISGSLAVAAACNPKMPLVQSMVAMNALSIAAAVVGLSTLFANFSVLLRFYLYENQNIGQGILSILTLFNALELGITISLVTFGCRTLCRDTFPDKVVVLYQKESLANAEQHPPLDGKQTETHP